MDQTTFWPDFGGIPFSSISRRMWAAQCHDNMTGLYPGLDGFLPSTLTEIVNTCLDFAIEAVKQKRVTFIVYIIYIHVDTYLHMYISRLVKWKQSFARSGYVGRTIV